MAGVLLILREVFGFLKLKQTRDALTNENQTVMEQMKNALEANTEVLEKISSHMDKQIDLLKDFAHEMREVRKDIDELRDAKSR